MQFFVIPAKAGILSFQIVINCLDSGACPGPDPGFTGVSTFYKTMVLVTFYDIINYRSAEEATR
jgi:hypothetical protein